MIKTTLIKSTNRIIKSKSKSKSIKKGGIYTPQLCATRDFSTYTNIYCFGDLEGQFPFTQIKEQPGTTITSDESLESYKKREAYFPKTKDGKNFIELENNHIKINTSEQHTDAFVFTGDLVDHGKYDIRWLMAINNNPFSESIMCAIGNRDYNKMRRIDESFIVKTDDSSIWSDVVNPDGTNKTLTEFVELISSNWKNYKFAYKYKNISNRFIFLQNNASDINEVRRLYNKNDPINRTRDIYSLRYTWGINEFSSKLDFPNYNYDELVELGIIEFNKAHYENITFKCVLINIVNMIMGVKWDAEIFDMFPLKCEVLNGLYVNYLKYSYFYGKIITNHNDEVAILSHGLVNKYISNPVGFPRDYITPVTNVDEQDKSYNKFWSKNENNNVNKNKDIYDIGGDIATLCDIINNDKNKVIDEFNIYWNNIQKTNTIKSHNNYKKTSFEDSFHRFNEFYYVRAPEKTKQFEVTDQLYQKGAGWMDNTRIELITTTKKYDYKYNIYGHSPQILVPTIATVNDNGKNRYYICIDISNLGPFKPVETIQTYNGTLNAYLTTGAFSYLIFKNNSVKIKGVITKGNFIIDPNVKFPIRYTKSLNTFMEFREDFTEADFGKRNIKFTQPLTYKTRSTGTRSNGRKTLPLDKVIASTTASTQLV